MLKVNIHLASLLAYYKINVLMSSMALGWLSGLLRIHHYTELWGVAGKH